MSTTFLLIRHAAHQLGGGTIAGRSPGVNLSEEGQRQAAALADRLVGLPVRTLYVSPVDRARQTAAIIAPALNLEPVVSEPLSEIDFGDWTRRPLDELRPLDRFRRWNTFRSGARIPSGELMLEAQTRIVREMLRLTDEHPDQMVALVSHGDIIKAAVAYFLGVPLDLFMRIEISLASVSVVRIAAYGPWVLCVNNTGAIITG